MKGTNTLFRGPCLGWPVSGHDPFMPTIWMIENDGILGTLLVGRLHAFGFEAMFLSDPHEALAQLESHAPKLILTELSWPGYSPADWVAAVLQKSPHTHVVAVTTIEDPMTLVKVFEAGVSDYVVKPFDFRTLIDKVRNICPSVVPRAASCDS
jgi:DNA-binding response OmpR family regulator